MLQNSRFAGLSDKVTEDTLMGLFIYLFISIKIGGPSENCVCKYEVKELTWQKIMAWAIVMAP